MPNHVTNIIQLRGKAEEIDAIKSAIQEDSAGLGSIDFEKIIPMPSHIFRGDLGRKEYELYGKNNWYDWSVANWGTKWNAYGFREFAGELNRNTIQFLSAWGAPHPVIQKLSEMYPTITVEHQWADEDIGYNCGQRIYQGGVIQDQYYPDYGKHAVEFALKVHGETPEERGLVLNEAGTEYVQIVDLGEESFGMQM